MKSKPAAILIPLISSTISTSLSIKLSPTNAEKLEKSKPSPDPGIIIILSEPMPSSCSEIDCSKPIPIDNKLIIADIPITIPRTVKAELVFLCFKVSNDIFKLS